MYLLTHKTFTKSLVHTKIRTNIIVLGIIKNF